MSHRNVAEGCKMDSGVPCEFDHIPRDLAAAGEGMTQPVRRVSSAANAMSVKPAPALRRPS